MKIERNYFRELSLDLSRPEVMILLGACQVGKTALMHDLLKYSKRRFEKQLYFNLEFPDDLYSFRISSC